jgi:hypothetical protein
VAPKPEKYENVSFDELLTYLMSVYSRVVKEDVIGPVIERMNEVLDEFAAKVSTTINVERLREVLELREAEGESDERMIESGFEYVCDFNSVKLFRKRK